MDILKAFSLLDAEYPINIQGTLEYPLFQANQIGKLLGIANINDNLRDFSEDERGMFLTDTLGGRQEATFLTELGLYRLLGRSRKPIAHKFQKWMISTLKEIRINGMYQLQQSKEIDAALYQQKCELSTHKTLLNAYHKRNVVYVCKFHNVENGFIVKIGSSQDIKERLANISNSFHCQEPLLLDVFESNNYKKFEKQIHRDPIIMQHYEKVLKKDGTTSRETYLINDKNYSHIIDVINKIKKECIQPDDVRIEELKMINNDKQIMLTELRIKQLNVELEIKRIELELKNATPSHSIQASCVEKQEDADDSSIISSEDFQQEEPDIKYVKKRNNGVNTPVVYQYNPDDLTKPMYKFDCPSDVERSILNVSPIHLK